MPCVPLARAWMLPAHGGRVQGKPCTTAPCWAAIPAVTRDRDASHGSVASQLVRTPCGELEVHAHEVEHVSQTSNRGLRGLAVDGLIPGQ